jgi:MFS family permease
VVCLGLSQLVAWGTIHYLIALFAAPIGAELGWSPAFVQGGFSLALVVMGLSSYRVGAWIDRHGGRAAMMAGCWCGAAGCALLAGTRHEAQFIAAWVLLGLAMRLALYDAAFAVLAHVAGAAAKRPMSIITLFGGLASTVFWPLGQALVQSLGWRGALLVYAGFLVLTSLLHLAIPRGAGHGQTAQAPQASAAPIAAPVRGAKLLYGVIALTVLFLQTGMATQFLELLRGLGWSAVTAVTLSTLLGLGQFTGRSCVVLWAHRMDAVRLNLVPTGLQCASFVIYLMAGNSLAGAAAFAFLYGAGNGIATITRGAMPLALFDPATYGRTVGALLKPALALSAAAPMVFAVAIERSGHRAAAGAALAIAAVALAAAVVLHRRVHHRKEPS